MAKNKTQEQCGERLAAFSEDAGLVIEVYMCGECEGVYTEKVSQCDCHFGEQKWITGKAIFPKENG